MAIGNILIYGATGYTGKIAAKSAHAQGLKPVLAGRNLEKVTAVAEPLGLTYSLVRSYAHIRTRRVFDHC
jgi:short subunit dehydrogenase-like uncharacterized protein